MAASPRPGLQAGEDPGPALLAAHNRVRAEVGVPPLEWSTILAATAQDWADQLAVTNGCAMTHSGAGENLFWASVLRRGDGGREPQAIAPEQVAAAWAAERPFYRIETKACDPGQVCGHYTQMVWRTTRRLGCAYRICTNDEQIWVCHYRPAGNVRGQTPY